MSPLLAAAVALVGPADAAELTSLNGGGGAYLADVQLTVGDATDNVRIGAGAGAGFEQGMTRRLGPMTVGLTFEMVDTWITRERWRELERQAAAEANAAHGWFWPPQASAIHKSMWPSWFELRLRS